MALRFVNLKLSGLKHMKKLGGKGEAPGKEFRRHSFELSEPLHWASNIPR